MPYQNSVVRRCNMMLVSSFTCIFALVSIDQYAPTLNDLWSFFHVKDKARQIKVRGCVLYDLKCVHVPLFVQLAHLLSLVK